MHVFMHACVVYEFDVTSLKCNPHWGRCCAHHCLTGSPIVFICVCVSCMSSGVWAKRFAIPFCVRLSLMLNAVQAVVSIIMHVKHSVRQCTAVFSGACMFACLHFSPLHCVCMRSCVRSAPVFSRSRRAPPVFTYE